MTIAGLLAALYPLAATWAAEPEFARPPYVGAYEPQGVDERGLWMQIDEAERRFRDSPMVLRDQQLNQFVANVLCRTVGQDRCSAARIYIVRDRSFNASMYPNGWMMVHTGLLSRVHSEAELATVLGHEFAHFELRHSLNGFLRARKTTDFLAWLSLAGAAANASTANSQIILIGSLFGFKREQETAADLLSAQYIRASPYRLRASQVWQRLIEENDALRLERGVRKVRHSTPGIMDTHPTNLQRIAYFSKLEQDAGEGGEDGIDEYRRHTAPFMADLFEGLVKSNDFASTDYVIRSRGDAMGWDGPLLYLRGELFRQRANPRDLVTARDLFRRATEQADAPVESWRGLGLCDMRLGDAAAGRASLARYLEVAPNGHDAAAIKMLLEN
ncbi:M48 family metallopeptidase [Sphingobium fontiphilum]|uniref:M48 family metallopeptidase n=1 Tax=Sphingobium fontiphilum TaxID=944425 RepID=UPI00160937E2|nr:M48 family metallopeptidase [Sphingobium fontiphilum]